MALADARRRGSGQIAALEQQLVKARTLVAAAGKAERFRAELGAALGPER